MEPLGIIFMALLGIVGTAVSNYIQTGQQSKVLNQQQDFNAEQANEAREESIPDQYNSSVQLGFNPDLAAASIMGHGVSTPYAASSPQAPQVPGLGSTFANVLSQIPSQLMNYGSDSPLVEGYALDNDMKRMEMNWKPLTYEATINYWDAYTSKLKIERNCSAAQLKILEAQVQYARPMAAAEYFKVLGQVNEAFAAADKYWADAALDEDLSAFYKSAAAENYSQIGLNKSLSSYYDQLKETEFWSTKKEKYEATTAFYDANIRTLFPQGYMSGDLMHDLFLMRATPEGKKYSDDLVSLLFAGDRELYDNQVDMQYKNWWKNFANGFTGRDAVNAGSGLLGAYMLSKGRVPNMKTGSGVPLPGSASHGWRFKPDGAPKGWHYSKFGADFYRAKREYEKNPTEENYWKMVRSSGD